jgi:hypothetical protein
MTRVARGGADHRRGDHRQRVEVPAEHQRQLPAGQPPQCGRQHRLGHRPDPEARAADALGGKHHELAAPPHHVEANRGRQPQRQCAAGQRDGLDRRRQLGRGGGERQDQGGRHRGQGRSRVVQQPEGQLEQRSHLSSPTQRTTCAPAAESLPTHAGGPDLQALMWKSLPAPKRGKHSQSTEPAPAHQRRRAAVRQQRVVADRQGAHHSFPSWTTTGRSATGHRPRAGRARPR